MQFWNHELRAHSKVATSKVYDRGDATITDEAAHCRDVLSRCGGGRTRAGIELAVAASPYATTVYVREDFLDRAIPIVEPGVSPAKSSISIEQPSRQHPTEGSFQLQHASWQDYRSRLPARVGGMVPFRARWVRTED